MEMKVEDSSLINVTESIDKFIMSSFKEITINDQTEDNTKPKKPVVAFKFNKTSPKLKSNLPAAKAFLDSEDLDESTEKKKLALKEELKESESPKDTELDNLQCTYAEPTWSSMPKEIYKIEVLKSGVILNSLDISNKSYYVIGKSLTCDISLSHDSIALFHAVLQYKIVNNGETEIYIYDLNSRHGTFLNGDRVNQNVYILLHSGNVISFGSSSKKYILQTPKDSEEKEAELSAEELQELKNLETEEREKLDAEIALKEKERSTKESQLETIDWGITESDENCVSTESSDESESDNEELYLHDPKKALRDWFKWEGYDLEYHTEDNGFGHFSCWIDLTLDPTGTTERIKADAVGDKMKAVDKCALNACRFLDHYGFLRQAQKDKKSTSRNWEEVDYYESDEDNFLDRTGVIERKRQQRMKMTGKCGNQSGDAPPTSLFEKHSKIVERRKQLEQLIALQTDPTDETEDSDEDALDAFMSKLNASNESEINSMKIELHNLQKEEIQVMNAINLNKSDLSNICASDITEKTKNGCR